MTRLETKQRRLKTRQCTSKRHVFKKHTDYKYSPSEHKKEIWMKGDKNDLFYVDKSIHAAMWLEVDELIYNHRGTCKVYQMARALASSNLVRKELDKVKPKSFEFEKRPNRNHASLKEKYRFTVIMYDFEQDPGSLHQEISSWEDAKDVLSKRFFFKELDEVDWLEREIHRLRIDGRRTYLSPYKNADQTTPKSETLLREIAAFPLQQKDHGKDALTEEIQVQSSRVEDADKGKNIEDVAERMEEKAKEEEAKRLASSLLRDFTEEEESMVQEAMWGAGPPNQVVQCEGPDSVQRGSIATLRPGSWLNDEVIHYFLVMLGKRDEDMCKTDSGRKRSHFFKSFFITKLLNEGHTDPAMDGQYEYRNVKRWSKKVPGKDIFNLDKIFFPINQGRMHWVCAVAFMQEKRIQFYDSMGADGMDYLNHIFHYIQDEHKDKKKSPLPDKDKWVLVPCTNDTPRQGNGFDCGVFTCMFADFLSKDCPLLFTQQHVNECRKRIALSICLGKAIV